MRFALVVITLAGLVYIALQLFLPDPRAWERDGAGTQVETLQQAVRIFHLVEGRLPEESEWPGFLINGSAGHPESYVSAGSLRDGALVDPWGGSYVYRRSGDASFVITCFGSDGEPGGTGDAADIVKVWPPEDER